MQQQDQDASSASIDSRDRPVKASSNTIWASDALAEAIRTLDIPFAAINPGASYRGLHDSIVNYLGNEKPQLLLCLHEEHAVHIALGWAKVTGKPMIAILHSNVGLMHGSMAIFNAWCDRAPMIVLGATGPVDAMKRRPWVDWIHTAKDQGALVRGFTKWDDQPASVDAAVESIMRAAMISQAAPRGPTYICFDVGLQETQLPDMPAAPDPTRFQAPPPSRPAADLARRAAEILLKAKRPLILAGRTSRDDADWKDRIELAERLGALVLTDLKTAAAFPNRHPLHPTAAGLFVSHEGQQLIREADAILSLDRVDLGGDLRTAFAGEKVTPTIMHASLDMAIHKGWSMDYQILPPVDAYFASEPGPVVRALLDAMPRENRRTPRTSGERLDASAIASDESPRDMTLAKLSRELQKIVSGTPTTLVRIPTGWSGDLWDIASPLDYLGYDGGGGLASGPGIAIGAGLALRDSGRIPISVIGDGDFLMGATALWTAARYGIGTLVIVVNNRSFFNDEVHQERVAMQRGRPTSNKWIGQRIGDPDIDIAGLARSQGAVGFGPVEDPEDLPQVLRKAVAEARSGKPVVVDVIVKPGYGGEAARSLLARPGDPQPTGAG